MNRKKSPLFEVKTVDSNFYETYLRDFLPERIFDVHVHIWHNKLMKGREDYSRIVKWPSLVARDNPMEDLLETYRLLFPGKKVTPLVFANLGDRSALEGLNAYVSKSAKKHAIPALIFAVPEWKGGELEEKIRAGGFCGTKVYLQYAPLYIPDDEIRIFDFIPHHQLKVLNDQGWILMLHIPRPARLRDPLNLAQMVEIEKRYPRIKLIIAHVGRAYCNEDAGNAFEVLAQTKNVMFDISANTNAWVFEQLIKAVGPKRILFGSDLPITRMRMRRICEKGCYINLVPKGLYGNISEDKHMREFTGKRAERLTFFLYEEIMAFRRAAEEISLSKNEIENVFYNNALKIIGDT
ncbi:MAG: amidohydrolase family protein [Candidatus Omnitrophota bacterium]